MKSINQISDFLDDNIIEIESHKGEQELKNLIKKFKLLYYPYKNIRRFAIPVIGCVSSGKSTILNYLLKLRKVLQMAEEITTKCVCIIRHQKGNKKAKIYEVEIKRRGGKADGFYNFEKGKEIGDNVAEVIAERNNLIANNKVGFNYEKYFLIIEYEIPFFLGDMEKYAELFEFMDVPGLNEKSEIKETSDNGEKKSSSIGSGFYFRQIFPLIKNNIKFSLFIFSVDNYDGKDAKYILNEYYSGKNNGDESNKKSYSNSDSEEARKYNEILLKKEKELQEQRDFCSLKSLQESIFILNKLDIRPQNEREKVNEEFKTYIENLYQGDKFIKLNDENEIPVMGKQLNEQVSKNDSFKEYIDYYNNNSKEYEDHSNCFYEYIIELMNKEFNLKLKTERESSEEESESNEDEEEKENEIPSYMDEEDFEDYKKLKEKVNKNDEFKNFITTKEYCKLKKIFKKNKNKKINNNNDNATIEKLLSDKMKKVIDEFFLIDSYVELQNKIITLFKINPDKNDKKKIQKKLEKMISNSKGIGNPKQSITDFYKYIQKIYSFDSSNDTIKKILSDYNTIKYYLENSSAARFLLVGPHNSGKSSIVLNIIGYNQNFLPVKTQECTKIGVIIKYAKKEEGIKMYETYFKTNEKGLNYFEYNENYPLAEGEESVLNKVDQLNNDPNAKRNLKFYLIKAPIEFLDQMELSEEKKKRIELIDFPGLDTEFDEAQKRAKDLLKIIDGFIYVNFNITFDSGNQEILTLMYKTIRQRNNFSFNTCLFILNKIDILEQNQEVDLNETTNKILEIFDKENEDLPSWKVLEQKERIGDKSLSLSKFSSKRYKEYKEFEENLLNFEKFIEISSQNDKKKNSDYEKSMNPLKTFQDEKILTIIINNLEKNYFDKINLKKLSFGQTYFDDYMKRLKNIIKIKNPDEKKMEKIVKLYLYILNNRTKLKKYKISYIDKLLKNYYDVINNTLKFFELKQRSDVLSFISNAYENLNALFHIIKLRMKDENINIFQQLNKDDIISSINREMSRTKNDISLEFESTKRIIDDKISRCNSDQKSFENMVSDNNSLLNGLIEKVKNKSKFFDEYLKEENEKIINKLNLKELQNDKDRFKEKMTKLEELNIGNNVSSSSSTYITTKTETYTSGWWIFESKYTKTVYEHDKTIAKYREKITQFFKEGKENTNQMIEENKNKIVYNINDIFNKFNEGINGFKKHINDFEKTVKEVEDYIYRQTGIK